MKPISEANLFSEEADEYEQDVANFLKEVDNKGEVFGDSLDPTAKSPPVVR